MTVSIAVFRQASGLRGMTAEQILALSDERALWQKFALDLARDAYAAGFADGEAAERFRASRAWAGQLVQRVVDGIPLAELERRRWGPGGREHFGDPRPGDYPGRDT